MGEDEKNTRGNVLAFDKLYRNSAPRRRASNLTGANPVWQRVSHPPVASLAWQSVTALLYSIKLRSVDSEQAGLHGD